MAGASRLLGCASLAALGLLLALVRALASERRLRRRVHELQDDLAKAIKERLAERTGRIRAQKELREKLTALSSDAPIPDSPVQDPGTCQLGNAGATGHAAPQKIPRYPLAPIGILRSCFTSRNGTPRQPLLVGQARAELRLEPTVPPSALEGLQDFSHCWLLYVFHANTDLPRLWDPVPHAATHAKIKVPRLDGEKRGCLATRSPHRPNPIGLSVAKIEAVEGRTLVLSGADVVDGTPVLDIKPYLPYCDTATEAVAPPWAQAGDGILAVQNVSFASGVEEQIERCWDQRKSSLFSCWQDLKGLAAEVLSRDIRSTWQRNNSRASSSLASGSRLPSQNGEVIPSAVTQGAPSALEEEAVVYHVVLDRVDFSYRIKDGSVLVFGAEAVSS